MDPSKISKKKKKKGGSGGKSLLTPGNIENETGKDGKGQDDDDGKGREPCGAKSLEPCSNGIICARIPVGEVLLTEDNLHSIPFGYNLVPWDGTTLMGFDIDALKKDAREMGGKALDLTSDAPIDDTSSCGVCDAVARHKCQNCLAVGYCSREHQKLHWKHHRPYCVLHEVSRDVDGMKCLIAKSNIKKGEAIFIEKPYIVTPIFECDIVPEEFALLTDKVLSGEYKREDYYDPTVCMGCSSKVDRSAISCAGCGWPICSESCPELDAHQKLECGYLMKNDLKFDEIREKAFLIPQVFGVIRCLLEENTYPDKWNMLFDKDLDTMSSLDDMKEIQIILGYLHHILISFFNFEELDYAKVLNFFRVFETKGFYGFGCNPNEDRLFSRKRIKALYQHGSLIRHRCLGNVLAVQTDPLTLHVIAVRNIKKGEILYRNFDQDGEIRDFIQRQRLALAISNKMCDCALCDNNSEYGKSLSAILCIKCKRRGYESHMVMTRSDVLDSPWKCGKCGNTKTMAQVEKLTDDMRKDFASCGSGIGLNSLKDVELSVRAKLHKYKGDILHPEHSLILAFENELIKFMMEPDRIQELTPPELELLVFLLKVRIRNLNSIVPPLHSSMIATKMQLVDALQHQARKTPLSHAAEILKTFEDLQDIHEDLAQSYVQRSKKNVMQGYILYCLRVIRKTIVDLGEVYNGQQRALNRSKRLARSAQYEDLVA